MIDDAAIVPRHVDITVTFAPNTPINNTPAPTQTPNPPVTAAAQQKEYIRTPGHRPTDTQEYVGKAKESFAKYFFITLLCFLGLGLVIFLGLMSVIFFDQNKLEWVTYKRSQAMAFRGLIYVLGCFAASTMLMLLIVMKRRKLGWIISILNFFTTWQGVNLVVTKIGFRGVIIWFFLLMVLDLGGLSGLGLLDTLDTSPTKYIVATSIAFILTREMNKNMTKYKYFWYTFLLGCTISIIIQSVFGWDIFHINQSFDSGLRMK